LQQWLLEGTSMLRYTHTVRLVENVTPHANEEKHLERRSYLISGDGDMLFQMRDMPQ
jgi:hypothetical protein